MIEGAYLNLYWVEDDDHHEDAFVVAATTDDATLYMLHFCGMDGGTVDSTPVAIVPAGLTDLTYGGAVPGWATDATVTACGGKIICEDPRIVSLGGVRYMFGALESAVEAARKAAKGALDQR